MAETYQHQNATLIAGTLVYYKLQTEEDTAFRLWNGLTSIGDIGTEGTFADDTTIADTVHTYIPGMKDTSELSFEFYLYNADENQDELRGMAAEGENITLKIEWPAGTVAKFNAALNGFSVIGGGNEDGVKGKIALRVSGDTEFSKKGA